MLATVAAADSASTVRQKYSVFIYSEGEPHAIYAIYKHTLTLCVLQYLKMYLEKNEGLILKMLLFFNRSFDIQGLLLRI